MIELQAVDAKQLTAGEKETLHFGSSEAHDRILRVVDRIRILRQFFYATPIILLAHKRNLNSISNFGSKL